MVTSVEPSGRQDGTIGATDTRGGLADRGIGFQAAGFAAVWLASTAALELFQGSDYWLYQWFERATVDTYWSALVPLAFLFDWIRKMFERGSEIRAAKRAEIREKIRREVGQETTARILEALQRHGITVPPELAEELLEKPHGSGS